MRKTFFIILCCCLFLFSVRRALAADVAHCTDPLGTCTGCSAYPCPCNAGDTSGTGPCPSAPPIPLQTQNTPVASTPTPTPVYLPNALGKNTDISTIIGIVIKGAMGIMGALVLLMIVWGGFQWLTSAGSPEKVKKGTQTMVWAVIGAFLALSSYFILSIILNFLTTGSGPGA